jgi:5-methylcytosine-specific restriction protein B
MANLGVILISGQEMVANLAASLSEPDDHPWAFTKWIRQMAGLTEGTYVAWIELVDAEGRQVNRFTPSSAELSARRVVVGQVVTPVAERSQPFFDGYPFEFRFKNPDDKAFDPALSMVGAAEWLNTHIDELGLQPDQLSTLIGHAKSNKVGLFIDGAPRMADYFESSKAAGPTPSSVPDGLAKPATAEPSTLSSPLGETMASFTAAATAAGLRFSGVNSDLPKALLASLLAKRFALLSGLSGSGKTLLARGLGQWFGLSSTGQQRYIVVPVRPDWTSPEPLLGYEDALLPPANDGRRAWHVPAVLRFILEADQDPDHVWLLILDEMNLAHVERYFADVLSGIESGEAIVPNLVRESGGYWRQRSGADPKSPLPSNLFVIGTVNVDETTYQFSPKVLDRAFSFEFRVASDELDSAAPPPTPVAAGPVSNHAVLLNASRDASFQLNVSPPEAKAIGEQLLDLHRALSVIGFEFGHRTHVEALRLASFLAVAGVEDADAALDWIVMTKILPRLHGSRRQLEPFLNDLRATAEGVDADKPVMPLTARKVARMLDLVRANQFVSFAE